ncbi:carbohydrate ABC transporter substrate-binding protein [Cryobacterium melibiosiphilum]|uniref:Carbohydrate ABC transporter substrate-binding protein n=1 Tax=Cryobacterium melibiosiphilum TaxID=995039 RepID=A0A3A5MGJ4_9MICO|nr:ABC transporter substrate-binding protein [Cryobacterium melibiosiphilum]RJT87971.1 carbohydrate ABC transporter substrate-binding protein [Cryobacterium melibiosiphilum]
MTFSRTTAVAGIASAAAIGLLLTGCTSAGNASDDGGDTELTVTTFGTFGYDDLYAQYESDHPGVTIKATNIDTGGNARTDLFTKLAAGSGVSDVVALEEGWLGSVMEVSDQFVDLNDFGGADIASRWVPWKLDQGTDADGRLIGYGTDIGPQGLCYNAPLFEAAGLPSDRASVAELFGGDDATWEEYFDLGRQYQAATGKAWFDQPSFVWNSMVNQLPEGYYTSDGELNIEGNADLEERWGWLTQGVADGLSAQQARWDWGGGKGFVDGSFATFVCPGWMLGVLQGNTESGGGSAATGWDFADVFPGGASNWGGAFLAVPATSEHQAQAAELAAWLTEPAQQVAQFEAAGTFPSTTEAQETLAADATPNEFFQGAPVGAILAERAQGVEAQFKGPNDSVIQENVFQAVLDRVDTGELNAETGWAEALKLTDELVDQ